MTQPVHVLVLYEAGRRGAAALEHAAGIASDAGARFTVVTVALAEPTEQCCDRRSVYWNQVVRELAEDELDAARDAVGLRASAEFRVVSGGSVPSAIALEAERSAADMIVMPRRRSLLPWARDLHPRQVARLHPHAVVRVAPG